MPLLKNRILFISHAWSYNEHYWTLVNWFNEEPNFSWSNCSVPSHDSLPDKTSAGLSAGMRRQIAPAQAVLVLGGMYAAHSKWIDYEIEMAWNEGKGLVGVDIHNLKDREGNQSAKGGNPFDGFTVGKDKRRLNEVVKAYDPPYLTSTNVYSYISENLADWIEEAIKIRNEF